ncbi:DMT family transporter [Pseudooctadecabacter jejudonensis]|uniref:Riboflavin transporter n=1 Tax=Pseudooctadecabacter jejudonensis TaxID=1391910 RepID=A0A1Y5RHK2_9RHOB|nr:DMT family transporter [Pseudooctadecabacter jejudonensis]SLN17302.1 Riboflavin transporter [Pseudooctadecabacter jejudonensis]
MENLRGAALMTASMFGFAVEDALIKGLSGTVPTGQIVAFIGLGGIIAFAVGLVARGQPAFVASQRAPKVVLRSALEAVGSMFFVSSLALIDLTLASAIIQATPLVVAMGAALFLGQTVGWRRWLAILIGFAGVLLIVKPGAASFDPLVILAIIGMLGLASRDLVTRSLNSDISGPHLSIAAFMGLVPAGLLLCVIWGQPLVWPTLYEWAILILCVFVGMVAYLCIIAATRAGDAAFISSFRYSRMLFALVLGALFFSEVPDALTLLGVTIVIAAGLFTLLREARLNRTSQASTDPL